MVTQRSETDLGMKTTAFQLDTWSKTVWSLRKQMVGRLQGFNTIIPELLPKIMSICTTPGKILLVLL
jgi:hypothetical protein